VGVDGSGKTTQAHRLAIALTESGLPATYWQNAGGRRWLGRLAKRLGRGSDPQRLLGRAGLLLVESILRWLAIARALLRSRLRGRIAVMDRYAVCQYASIRAHEGSRLAEWLARRAYSLFPRPDATFFLAVDPAVAVRRIDLRAEDHESEEFLATSTAAYRSLPEFGSFVVINANGTPDEVTARIEAHLTALAGPIYARP
jgi:dTMP kinase